MMLLGKNVEAMFTRVAAVLFENVIQSEISAQQHEKKETIGRGNTLISEWCDLVASYLPYSTVLITYSSIKFFFYGS